MNDFYENYKYNLAVREVYRQISSDVLGPLKIRKNAPKSLYILNNIALRSPENLLLEVRYGNIQHCDSGAMGCTRVFCFNHVVLMKEIR